MWAIYHSSDKFAEVSAVSMVSLFENNKSFSDIHILYIERDMSDGSKEKLRKIAERYGRTIEFVPMPNWSERLNIKLSTTKKGWLGFGYNRLFITELVPDDVDRVLYLDSDTLIEGDLTKLWNIDFKDNYIAGVDDCLSRRYAKLVDLPENGTYCNSGMLLMNLKKWREDNIKQTFIDYIYEKKGYFVFNEQSILNHVFAGKILILPPEYNTVTIVFALEYDEMHVLRMPRRYSYSKKQYLNARKSPKIVHYTGLFMIPYRPWEKGSTHPHLKAFMKYRQMTPWANAPLMDANKGKFSKICQNICMKLPRKFMLKVVSFVYNYLRVMLFWYRKHKFLSDNK
ncbi:MAG: glycosyltransferase family 8 protein [Ruminococcus sp.]|nr:glycosyltransferase family 8 protein [Ruminococcus sp.]